MSDWLQWAITTIVGILGIFIGRTWENRDRKLKKDSETFKILQDEFPEDRPSFFFLDKDIEKARSSLKENMENFQDYVATEVFAHNENSRLLSIALPEERSSRKIAFLQRSEDIDSNTVEELEQKANEDYIKTRETLNYLATKLYNSYKELVVIAHKKL